MNTPLNLHVIIDYGEQTVGNELKPSYLHRDIRKRLWSWWDTKRKNGVLSGKLTDIVIWEAPKGKHHAHWMLYVPEHLFEEAQCVIENRSTKVLGTLDAETLFQGRIWNLEGLTKYLLKGTEPEYADRIDIQPSNQGEVWCRRAVPARALGRTARRRDWRTDHIVNKQLKQGIPKPKELRDLLREKWVA